MKEINYPLASPSWDILEIEAMNRVITSGMFSMGNEVKKFENQFADYFGKKYAIMANSGSSANLLMIAALFFRSDNPIKRGDEVIVPAVSWSTTYMPLQQYGLKLKFVDIDIDTLNFDLHSLEEAISEKTKIILAVNLLGNPNDFKTIKTIIGNNDIILLEDNCEAMGAKYEGKYAGSVGLMGSFSSFFSHHISTMEGGMVITDDEELYHIMLSIRAHGWTRNLPFINKITGKKSDNDFEESFKFVLPGYNLRPLELSGAIGQEQLKKLRGFVAKRRENAQVFIEHVSNIQGVGIQKEIGESSYFGFSILLENSNSIERNKIIQKLTENGIECRPIVGGNFLKNPVIKYFDYAVHGNLNNAQKIDECGFFIGNHHFDLKNEIIGFSELLKSLI